MSEDNPEDSAAAEAESGLEALTNAGDRVESALEKLTTGCEASAVFGAPQDVGDKVIITASTVEKMGGFGFGGGGGMSSKGEDKVDRGGGGGGGGGGNSEGRPVAVIEISPAGVEVKPVLDFTKIGLAAIAAVLAIWRLSKKGGK